MKTGAGARLTWRRREEEAQLGEDERGFQFRNGSSVVQVDDLGRLVQVERGHAGFKLRQEVVVVRAASAALHFFFPPAGENLMAAALPSRKASVAKCSRRPSICASILSCSSLRTLASSALTLLVCAVSLLAGAFVMMLRSY